MEVQGSRLIGRPCWRRWRSITGARWTIFRWRADDVTGDLARSVADPPFRTRTRKGESWGDALTVRCGEPTRAPAGTCQPRLRRPGTLWCGSRRSTRSGSGTARLHRQKLTPERLPLGSVQVGDPLLGELVCELVCHWDVSWLWAGVIGTSGSIGCRLTGR